jgi:hypothetical protein
MLQIKPPLLVFLLSQLSLKRTCEDSPCQRSALKEGCVFCVIHSLKLQLLTDNGCHLLLFVQSEVFPSPGDIASAQHKRFWVSNNDLVRGQLVLSHKWMLFIPSHCPAQNAQVKAHFPLFYCGFQNRVAYAAIYSVIFGRTRAATTLLGDL